MGAISAIIVAAVVGWSMVSSGPRLVAGSDLGADSASPDWRLVPPPPLSARSGSSAVWAAERFIVWGGQDARRTATDDGAAYDVATTTWRRIASPPPGLSGGRAIAWGPEMAIVSASSAAAYDPIRDGWRLLPSPAIAPDEEILDILTVSDGLGSFPTK